MRKNVLWMMVAALLVLGCNPKNSSSKSEDDEEVRELETKVYDFSSENQRYDTSISIEMPVGGDEELGDSIYGFIRDVTCDKQAMEGGLTEYRDDGQALVDFLGEKLCVDLSEGWESFNEGMSEEESTPMSEHIKFRITEDNDKFITGLYEYDSYYGGDGFMDIVGVTYLKDDVTRVTSDFLFKNPDSQKLLNLIISTLKEDYCHGEHAFLEEEELEGIDKLPHNFYLTADGLVFNYSSYEIHWAQLHGVLPYKKVKDLLTDEAKELF